MAALEKQHVFSKGDKCWVADEQECFISCTIKEIRNGFLFDPANFSGNVICFDESYRQFELPMSTVFPVNPGHMDGVKDNTELMFLQDPSLLHNIMVERNPTPYCRFAISETRFTRSRPIS